MFTGIIESVGVVESIEPQGSGRTFTLSSELASALKVDQSVSHDGVCLTVESVTGSRYQVTAVLETLQKTNLGTWTAGKRINLERCMTMNGRLDGHIVQGHADTTAECVLKEDLNGSWTFRFRFDRKFAPLVIEKGSISVNGISLTVFDITETEFSVAVIPYTFSHTNISSVEPGSTVNIEFDVIGKYVQRMQSLGTQSHLKTSVA